MGQSGAVDEHFGIVEPQVAVSERPEVRLPPAEDDRHGCRLRTSPLVSLNRAHPWRIRQLAAIALGPRPYAPSLTALIAARPRGQPVEATDSCRASARSFL